MESEANGTYTIHWKPVGEQYAHDLYQLYREDAKRLRLVFLEAGYIEKER